MFEPSKSVDLSSASLSRRSELARLALPSLDGFALVAHIPTSHPARIWRDGSGEVKVFSNEMIYTIARLDDSSSMRFKFQLVQPRLFALEDVGSGSISMASMAGDPPTRVVAQMLSSPDSGSRLEVKIGDRSYQLTHSHRITSLALTPRSNHIYFGDSNGGVHSGFVKQEEKFISGQIFKIKSERDQVVVGISMINDFLGAVTSGGKFVESYTKSLGNGPIAQVSKRIGGRSISKVIFYRQLCLPDSDSCQTLDTSLDPDVSNKRVLISGFSYINSTYLAFALAEGGIVIYKRLNDVK